MKRGMATWYKESGTSNDRKLAVFIGSDSEGYPVIQTPENPPFVTSWAKLSQVLKDDEE